MRFGAVTSHCTGDTGRYVLQRLPKRVSWWPRVIYTSPTQTAISSARSGIRADSHRPGNSPSPRSWRQRADPGPTPWVFCRRECGPFSYVLLSTSRVLWERSLSWCCSVAGETRRILASGFLTHSQSIRYLRCKERKLKANLVQV